MFEEISPHSLRSVSGMEFLGGIKNVNGERQGKTSAVRSDAALAWRRGVGVSSSPLQKPRGGGKWAYRPFSRPLRRCINWGEGGALRGEMQLLSCWSRGWHCVRRSAALRRFPPFSLSHLGVSR